MKTVGINTVTDLIRDILLELDLPVMPEVVCFHDMDKAKSHIHVRSPYFKKVEEYVDEAWERNKI